MGANYSNKEFELIWWEIGVSHSRTKVLIHRGTDPVYPADGDFERLPIFAERITGDPHNFDKKNASFKQSK